jgi:hypothetical protein
MRTSPVPTEPREEETMNTPHPPLDLAVEDLEDLDAPGFWDYVVGVGVGIGIGVLIT